MPSRKILGSLCVLVLLTVVLLTAGNRATPAQADGSSGSPDRRPTPRLRTTGTPMALWVRAV